MCVREGVCVRERCVCEREGCVFEGVCEGVCVCLGRLE